MSQVFADSLEALIQQYKEIDGWAGSEGDRVKILRDIRKASTNPEYWIIFAKKLWIVAKEAKEKEDQFREEVLSMIDFSQGK